MRRKAGLFVVCGIVLPLASTTSAHAQGSTLQVNVADPTPGQSITVTGNNFTAAAGNSPVTIRLSTRNGTVLSSPTPDSLGQISATFPVPPSLTPGWYLLLATQTTTVNNRHRAFTPGRVRIRVRAPSVSNARAGAGGGPRDGGPPLLVPGALGAMLLAAGGGAVGARRLRTRPSQGR